MVFGLDVWFVCDVVFDSWCRCVLLVLCIFAGFDLDLRVGFGYGLLMIGVACWVVCVVCCSCLVLCFCYLCFSSCDCLFNNVDLLVVSMVCCAVVGLYVLVLCIRYVALLFGVICCVVW